MSGPPMVESINFTESEARPVLGPAGNKARSLELRKPVVKTKNEMQKPPAAGEAKGNKSPAALKSPGTAADKIPSPVGSRKNAGGASSILRQRQANLSMNASCSSDASTESSHSRASTGRITRRIANSAPALKRKPQYGPRGDKFEMVEGYVTTSVGSEGDDASLDDSLTKKRCAWVTSNTDPLYVAFHDEEWGLPVHDDRKLFELLSFSTALADITWPVILSKRLIFRDVFLNFDPMDVSKLNEKKIAAPGSPASSLLPELKLRAIIENARYVCKIIDEVGSFDKYIWSFVNHKPIAPNFRYPRQVPIKTSKADTISKDLVRRGFRGVGPTVVYSFMQVAGITNDHLISCFRYHDCINVVDLKDKNEMTSKNEGKVDEDFTQIELSRDMDDLNLSR